MSINGHKKSKISNSNYIPSPINKNYSNIISNSNLYRNNTNFSSLSYFDNCEEDFDLFAPSKNQARTGRIIHKTTEHSIGKKGIRIVKTKIVREIDPNLNVKGNRKNKKIKIITKNRSHANYNNLNLNNNPDYFYPKANKLKKDELYSSPDYFEVSPNNNEIISPVSYIPNCSSGSDYDEYYMKSHNNKNMKYNKKSNVLLVKNNIQSINYELEDLKGFDYLKNNEIITRKNYSIGNKNTIILNRSEFHVNNNRLINNSCQSDFQDFQSPDRAIDIQNKFRKITENMINPKGPSNNDKKVTKIIKTTINLDNKKHNKISKIKKIRKIINYNLSQIEAAKIIQKWWRNNKYKEEEIYDITVKSVIKLQSFIRGYLIRKKVLRYIMLAIYYQSFCDKLQDVLCNNIKRNVFNIFKKIIKNKKLKLKKSSTNMINLISNNNSRSFISSKEYQSPQTHQSSCNIKQSINDSSSTKSNNKYNMNFSQHINNNNYNTRNIHKKILIKGKNKELKLLRNKIWRNKNYYTQTSINNTTNNNSNLEDIETVKTTRRIITSNIRKISYKKNKNEIMSGGTLSIIKLPNRKIKYSESENLYTHIKEYKKKKIYISNKSKEEQKEYPDPNSLCKKIIIREELKPETAEDGNYRQSFNMEISRISNLSIKASQGIRRLTKEEIKEMEIFKKREKSKNKEIIKYKKCYEKEKNKNKLDTLKHAIKIIEMHKKSIFKKILEKFRKNKESKENRDIIYEIKNANNIEIKQELKEKNDFGIQISAKKEEEGIQTNKEENIKKQFDKLLITENRQVSFNGKQKLDKKDNIIISNDKLYIISNIKKEEFGSQIGSWDTKIEKNEKNNINIIKKESKAIETDTQLKAFENKITKSKFNIISKIAKEDYIKKENNWNPIISKPANDINIIYTKPKKIEEASQYINIKNTINKNEQFNIIDKKPILVDIEIQHEPQDNQITKSKFDIISKISKNEQGSQIEIIKAKPNNNEITKIKNEINIISTKPEKVEECTQYTKLENIIDKTKEYKIIQNKKDLTEKGIQPDKIENKITKTKLDILSNISQDKKDKIWIKKWKPIIVRNNSAINILPSKTKQKTIETGIQYIKQENSIYQIPHIKIIHNKPKLIDAEIQHEPENNYIDKKVLEIEIKSNKIKPEYKDSITQYDIINNEIIDEGINTMIEEDSKPKKIEIKIGNVRRSIINKLKKIYMRKAFKTFKLNCKRPEYNKIMKKELLRMYILKWRFIKGYGPDRYGNIYDRNGILLNKIEGKVEDEQIQQEFIIEKEEQSTQYTPIENVISTLKQMEINRAYNRKKEPEKKEIAIGNDLILGESIERNYEINYVNKKEKQDNIIDKNTQLEIKHDKKILKDESTVIDVPLVENKIINSEKINISREKYNLKKKISSRKKTLLTQILYKKIINEKLTLCDSLRQWLKQSLLLLQKEKNDIENNKKNYVEISQNEQFALIEEINKMEFGTQIEKEENKIQNLEKINIINKIQKIDSEVNVDIPSKFNKLNPQNQTNISYKIYKKPTLLIIKKENDVNILNENYINKEEIEQEIKTRIKEILYKYINSRGTKNSSLRKYFTIWHRNANYLTLMENANIISDFCKNNFDRVKNYRKWKKISEKLIIKERMRIIKKTKIEYLKKNKIMDLIRLTRINIIYTKRRYLHYILLCWLALTKNLSKKKQHIKILYENMLNTYMNMTDDLFGNNKNENQSVQDALYEVANTDKYKFKDHKDVPIAEEYYKNKKESSKITKNIIYINKNNSYVNKNFIPLKLRGRICTSFEKKVVKVAENERLHSKGRGRKFRTKDQKEILDKFSKHSYNQEEIKNEKENLNMNQIENNSIKTNNYTIKFSTETKNRDNINKVIEKSDINYSYNKEKIYRTDEKNKNIHSFFV